MESDVPAAIAFEYFHAALGQQFGLMATMFFCLALRPRVMTGECSSRSRTSPMRPSLRRFDQALLQAQAGGVVDGAELEDGDQEIRFDTELARINTDQKHEDVIC